MTTELSIDDKYNLIIKNLQETIIDENIVKKILAVRPLKVYWGTSPTSTPSIAYFVPMMKIRDLVMAGCEVTILIADLHAVLDNLKSTFEQVEYRSQYYIAVIKAMLISLNIDINKIKFIKGSEYQLSKEYTMDMYKAHTLITVNEAKHAGAEVVKQNEHPKMAGLMYPTLQALDEQYLGVDIELSGLDQRKLFGHALNIMPKLGYKKRMYLMTNMISGLRTLKQELKENQNIQDKKMSSSNKDSKIDLLDSKNQLKIKINKAYCLPGDITDNCLIEMLENLVYPILNIKGLQFVIERKEEYGGNITYVNSEDIKNDFKTSKLHPMDLKQGMINNIDLILDPIRKTFDTPEMKKLIKQAYS